ncbi:hypothetical protein FPOA_11854 [Fusarium poae]|uniref:Uncharacterized protein n=1 Tax=Fusarium poae TaxID=36050 RepID=A0A1B8AHZ1_FUSPO|nr:hypothetical protein FPOA_11854 [Fusarium poae]
MYRCPSAEGRLQMHYQEQKPQYPIIPESPSQLQKRTRKSIKDQKRLELRDRCKSDPLLCAAILKKLAGRKPQRKDFGLVPGGDAQASNNEPGSSTIDLDDDFAENDKETLEADADDQFQTQIEQNEEVNTFPDELPDDVVAQLPHVDYAAAARGLCP